MSYLSPSLELPVHLVSLILAQLDSMQSLGSAILSHSIFYQSFRDDTKRIVQGILRNQIPPELMQYAAAAFETKFVDNNDEVKVGTLLRSAFEGIGRQQNGVQFQEWCLEWIFDHNVDGTGFSTALITRLGDQTYQSMGAVSIANVFSKTHGIVEYFCGRFAGERLPLIQHLMVGWRPEACPSKREAFRIRRALYRFQIYCNLLFRNENDFHPERRVRQMRSSYIVRHFFGCFSPWVDEQLACIHDYLEDILSRAFDDVAAHDVDWGAKSVDWLAQGRRNEYKQAYVSVSHFFRNKRHTPWAILTRNLSSPTVYLFSSNSIIIMDTNSAISFWYQKAYHALQ